MELARLEVSREPLPNALLTMRSLLALLAFSLPAVAQEAAVPSSDDPAIAEYGDRLAQLRAAVPALVLYGEGGRAPMRQQSAVWIGDGRAVTSASGLVGVSRAELEFESGVRARVLGLLALDADADLALIAVDATGELPVPIATGSRLFGISRPVGVVGVTITQQRIRAIGRVTHVHRIPGLGAFALTRGLEQRGLAGGAVLDEEGKLVGMLTNLLAPDGQGRIAVSIRSIRDLNVRPLKALEEELIPDISSLDPARSMLCCGDAEGAGIATEKMDHAHGRLWRGLALIDLDRAEEAVELLEALVATEATPGLRARLALGEAYLASGKATRALRIFRDARRSAEDSPAPRYHAARAYAALKRNQDTLVHLDQTLKRDPKHVEALVLRGEIRLRQLAFPNARRDFDAALALDPRNVQARTGLGAVHFEEKDFERALLFYEAAIALSPQDIGTQQRMAKTLIKLDRPADARAAADKAVALAPRRAEPRVILAEVLVELDLLDDAEQSYEAAVLLNPEYIEANMGLGSVRLRLSHVQEAQIAFHDVLRLDPQHGAALFNSGLCYVMQGDTGKARERYKTLQHIDPRSARVLYERIYGR